MSWRKRRLRLGMAEITLAGAGAAETFTWSDPDTINAASPTQIELEQIPDDVTVQQKTQGTAYSGVKIVATKAGGTITPNSNTDTSKYRIVGRVD